MGYCVDYAELEKALHYLERFRTNLLEGVHAVADQTAVVVQTASFTGSGADSMKQYCKTVYPTIHSVLQTLVDTIYQNFVSYYYDYYDHVDSSGDTRFTQDMLISTTQRCQDLRNAFARIDSEVEDVLQQIQDIVKVPVNGMDEIYSQHTTIINGIIRIDETVRDLENRHFARFSQADAMIVQLEALLTMLIEKERGGFEVADFAASLQGISALRSVMQAGVEGQEETVKKKESEIQSLHTAENTDNRLRVFSDEFHAKYGWKEILAGSGYIGDVYNLIDEIKNGKDWKDFTKAGVKVYQFMSGAAKTYKNYRQIGKAVGTKVAMSWWAKNAVGWKPLGRASAAKSPVTRFVNNLTNKTSPFNAQIKNVVNNFTGANGVGKAVASWGAVAVNGVLNWFGNKEEQAASNGMMSDGRVIAETITETAVDTALTYGAGIVVGAAVTAALGTVAAPGVVVVALSGLAVAGLNAGVKALTGKSATEWVSDTILDSAEAIGKRVSKVAKGVLKPVENWSRKLLLA